MIVNKIEWMSKEAQEAILYIGDGEYECAAFSHPCNLEEEYVLVEPLLAFSVEGLMIAEGSNLSISRKGESLAHDVVGKLLSVDPLIIKVGSFKIELEDPLPGGIKDDSVVQFSCGRLDVIR
ncbi:hypothetical protein RS130_06255 [Paraglaciecola aquimarina]|uniref:Uncharacterized protein n=1 Tax=Paraglaciecola aquimarina TaxID=1235557 RepID=A0ABU3SUA9_9ALTE|nr:hypothetical protein [Paraglaciecola aquimarina]MDU0353585.1 hypothetical protein [Paraglaciecola aquimarina]